MNRTPFANCCAAVYEVQALIYRPKYSVESKSDASSCLLPLAPAASCLLLQHDEQKLSKFCRFVQSFVPQVLPAQTTSNDSCGRSRPPGHLCPNCHPCPAAAGTQDVAHMISSVTFNLCWELTLLTKPRHRLGGSNCAAKTCSNLLQQQYIELCPTRLGAIEFSE